MDKIDSILKEGIKIILEKENRYFPSLDKLAEEFCEKNKPIIK